MNLFKVLSAVALAAAIAGIGVAGGWHAASRSGPRTQEGPEQADESPELSERALANIGVRWAEVSSGDYTIARGVPASVSELPSALRPVSLRWGGTVKSVLPSIGGPDRGGPVAQEGVAVAPGTVLAEVFRDPLPMIDRAMTGEIVQAVSETVHEAATAHRSAEKVHELAKLEWERVSNLNKGRAEDLPLVPRQTEINLKYEMLKAEAELKRIETGLFLHGFTKEQIKDLSGGGPVPHASELWKRALVMNGLWPETGDQILYLLPNPLKTHPWTFAGIGELNALGKCGADLLETLRVNPGLGPRFLELAALLQRGHSAEDATDLFRSGSLDPVISVRAPSGVAEWELREVLARPGQKVEAGAVIAVLADSRRMLLILHASGADSAAVEKALESGDLMDAAPMVEGAGPALNQVKLSSYRPCSESGSFSAYAVVDNSAVSVPVQGSMKPAAWRLRPGMKYKVNVPVRSMKDVFALPRAAVVKDGAERVVFIRSGRGFRTQPVRVLHEDFRNSVVAADGAIFDGDPVVISGAFALHLALKAGSKSGAAQAHKHGPT